ncbi:MAG TPA: hypothetical protein PLZ03_00280 [Anaerolineales bacterium]|nr:hypothetical protein [Anaerolineales bacterium]
MTVEYMPRKSAVLQKRGRFRRYQSSALLFQWKAFPRPKSLKKEAQTESHAGERIPLRTYLAQDENHHPPTNKNSLMFQEKTQKNRTGCTQKQRQMSLFFMTFVT